VVFSTPGSSTGCRYVLSAFLYALSFGRGCRENELGWNQRISREQVLAGLQPGEGGDCPSMGDPFQPQRAADGMQLQ